MNAKKKFLQEINVPLWRRFLANCPCNKAGYAKIEHIYMGKLWPQVYKHTADPSVIYWPNLGVSKMSRICRGIFVYLVSLLLMIVCFTLIAFAVGYKK